MDTQDHGKATVHSGHDGHEVHLCRRCGWPFPNPHPSARHRRAHKKICGTIEGYTKLTDSGVVSDDDEHHSDEDKQETPIVNIEKKVSIKESVGGATVGIGERSSRSEDDMFSDAVTEFSDSGISQSVEERVVGNGDFDKTLDRDIFLSFNDTGNADATEPAKSLVQIAKVENLVDSETPDDKLVKDTPSEDAEKIDKIEPLESDGKTSNPLDEDGVVGQSDGSQKVESIDPVGASADALETKQDLAEDVGVSSGHVDMVEVSDKKEEREEAIHVLSVASDIPAVEHSESLLQGFKDHRAITSDVPVILGSAGDKDTVDDVSSSAEASSTVETLKEEKAEEKIQETEVSENGQSSVESTTNAGQAKTDFFAVVPTVTIEESKTTERQPLETSKTTPGSLDSLVEAEVPPVSSLHEEDHRGEQEKSIDKLSDVGQGERTEVAASEEISEVKEEKLEPAHEHTPEVGKEPKIDHDVSILSEKEDTDSPIVEKCSKEYTQEVVVEGLKADSKDIGDVEISEKSAEKLVIKEAELSPNGFEQASENSTTMEDAKDGSEDKNASGGVSKPVVEEGNVKLTNNQDSGVDMSVDSSSHNSLEGNWGSVSVLSIASVDAETSHSIDKSKVNSEKSGTATVGCLPDKSDDFEHPSLVEPKVEVVHEKAGTVNTEIEDVQSSKQQPKSEASQAEVIEKVTNWSTERHSTPLKNLLSEAKSPNPKQLPSVTQKDAAEEKNNGNAVATEKTTLTSEAPPAYQDSSPPKYIGEDKKDRKKAKGKASWIPLFCCSSVNVN